MSKQKEEIYQPEEQRFGSPHGHPQQAPIVEPEKKQKQSAKKENDKAPQNS